MSLTSHLCASVNVNEIEYNGTVTELSLSFRMASKWPTMGLVPINQSRGNRDDHISSGSSQ